MVLQDRKKRISGFTNTLNDINLQYLKLLNDYFESVEKAEELENNLSVVQSKLRALEDRGSLCAKCDGTKRTERCLVEIDKSSDYLIAGSKNVPSDDVENKTENIHDPLIDSRGDNTGNVEQISSDEIVSSIEEISDDINNIQTSPIVRRTKLKSNAIRKKPKNRGLTTNAVSRLLDLNNENVARPEVQPTISNNNDKKTVISSLEKANSSVQVKSRSFNKLNISTTENVRTKIIPGSNKILKQSKLVLSSEICTDLSSCDDVLQKNVNSSDRTLKSNVRDIENDQCSPDMDIFLENSMIHMTPMREQNSAKVRQTLIPKDQNSRFSRSKINSNSKTRIIKSSAEKTASTTNSVVNSQDDSDLTFFEPRGTSTQYNHIFTTDHSIQKQPAIQSRNAAQKAINLKTSNVSPESQKKADSDDTIFIDFLVPSERFPVKGSRTAEKWVDFKSKSSSFDEMPDATSSSNQSTNNRKKTDKSRTKDHTQHETLVERKRLLDDFNVLPKKRPPSPNYVYQGSPVRKKTERAQLNGWSCWKCKNFYESMGLNEKELRMRQDQCSRHRSKSAPQEESWAGFWNPEFTSPYDST